MIQVIKHKTFFISFSGIIIVASFLAIVIFGFQPGIEFTGGTLWQISTNNPSVNETTLHEFFANTVQRKDAIIYPDLSSHSYIIKLPTVNESEHQQYLAQFTAAYGTTTELQFQAIGPTIGEQLKQRSIQAIILVILVISTYIALAFRKVSYPVKSWKYGVVTMITLFHDVVIPAGVLAVLSRFWGVEMDSNFIVALLVIMGFSVHDTIVVFDRIRENLLTRRGVASFDDTVNESINQTFARSINTSLALALVLVAMLIFGQPSLRLFVAIMLIGTIAGTYSSIFVASPLLTIWHKFSTNKGTGSK
ncbi:MAG: protein translocase subunit SecF [Candidatus Paceibacterota bacterium]|jgi:preprotein translocase subunit SecF